MGKLDAALASYREALAIDEALVAADPTSAEARRDLAVTRSDLGGVYMRMAVESASEQESLSRYREARVSGGPSSSRFPARRRPIRYPMPGSCSSKAEGGERRHEMGRRREQLVG